MERTELDEHLDRVLIGGREPVEITIVDSDPRWPERYTALESRIRTALGATVLAVHHIGSTAVPGLAAKPIIDVLLLVRDVEDEAAYVPALEAAGLALRVREPGHRMLRAPDRTAHVHVSEPGDPAVADWLHLRDWLRHDAVDRAHYEQVKRRLAERSWADMNHYAEAKRAIVQQVLGRARAWRAEGSCTASDLRRQAYDRTG